MGQLNKTDASIAAAKWDKLRTWGTLKDDIEKKLHSGDKNSETITLEIGPQLLYSLRHPSLLRCTSHFSSKLGEVFATHYNKGAVQAVKVWTLNTKGKAGSFKKEGIETAHEIMCMTYVSKHRVYLTFCRDLHLRVFTDVHSNFVEVHALPCLTTVLCLIYNKEEDEVYAGGIGFLEEWRIQGAEHAASAVPGKKFQTELTRNEWILDIKIDKQNEQMFAIHGDGICVVNMKTRKQVFSVPNRHDGPLKCCCYYSQSDFLVTGGADGKIKLFNGTVFNFIHVFIGHHGPVSGVEPHTKDTLLFSCSLDGTVRLWRMDSLQIFMRLDIGERILNISLLGTNEFFFQTEKDILIYNLNQFYELFAPVESETQKLVCCRGKGKANRILGSTEDGSVRLFSPVTGLTLTIIYPMPSFQVLTSFAYDIHQDCLHTVLTEGQVLKYNTSTNPCKAEELWVPRFGDELVNNLLLVTVEFDCDDGTDFDNLVFAGLKNGQIILCEAVNCSLEAPIQAHEGAFTCLESCQHLTEGGLGVLETSRTIMSGGTDKFVKLWSINISCENRRPTVNLTPLLKIYLPAVPSHVCMFSKLLSVVIRTHTKQGPRWPLIMYQLVAMKKGWGSVSSFMPIQITHCPDEDHMQELTALDKCIVMKVVLTAGKDGFVKIWNSQNELLREMNFLTPIYASCFANDRGDVLVGYKAHICSVSVENYLPLTCLRNVVTAITDLYLKDDAREPPVPFDHTCQPWLDISKLNRYSLDIVERRRQHLEKEIIDRLKQNTVKDKTAKFVIFVDGKTTKVIRKDFADRLLNWAKGKNTLKLGRKFFEKLAVTEDQKDPATQEKGKSFKERLKDVKTNKATTAIPEEEEEKEYLDSWGLIQIYASTVGHALRALTQGGASGPDEMKLLEEKELLKRDPIIAPDGYIPNSVIRRKMGPPKVDPFVQRLETFMLKPVPKVNPDHMPAWWSEGDPVDTTLALATEEKTREFSVAKWEDTPSPSPRSEAMSSVSSVSIESFIDSPVKKYIHEGRSTSPKSKPGVSTSRAGRVSKGGSVSREQDDWPVKNVKKMMKLNDQNGDKKKKKSVWEDSTSSDQHEDHEGTVGHRSVTSSNVRDTRRSPTGGSDSSLDGRPSRVKPSTPAAAYKSGSAKSIKSRVSSCESVKSKRIEMKRYDLDMGTPNSKPRQGQDRSRSFKLTNLAVDEDSSAIHVKASKSGRRRVGKANMNSEIIQQLMQETWLPAMTRAHEDEGGQYEELLDNLITSLDNNNNPAVYDRVCRYITNIHKELDIPEEQLDKMVAKLGVNLNSLNSDIKKYTIKTLQVLGKFRTDVLLLILPKLVDPEEPIRRVTAEAVEELTGAHNKEELLKILDEMGLTAGLYSSKADEELVMKVLAEQFADREDPELLDRIQNWVERTTPGVFEEERDDDQLWQEGSRSRKSSMLQGTKEQSFMSDRSAFDMYDTSGRTTMYMDMPSTPSELSELVLSRDVSMHDSKSAGLKSANSHYRARMDLMNRGGATVLPGERDEIPTPISDDEYVRIMNERYGLVPSYHYDNENGHSLSMGDSFLTCEKSNLTNETLTNTPKSLEGMLLKERTLTDISQVGPLPSFLPTDNTRNFDDVSTDSAFESAISTSDCATSHLSEKMMVSHMDQQSSKHSQLSEENNMFDVEVVSTLEYEGDLDDNLSLNTSKSMTRHGLMLENISHSMLSEISNCMPPSNNDEAGEVTTEGTPRESTSVDRKETSKNRKTDTGSTLKKKMHEMDEFSTISDRSSRSRKTSRDTTQAETLDSTPTQDKTSPTGDDDIASHSPDTPKSDNKISEPKLDSEQDETSESREDDVAAELPNATALRQKSYSHYTTMDISKGTPANSLTIPLWEEETTATLNTTTLTEPQTSQDISAVSLDTLLVSKDGTKTTGFSKETTTSTFSKELNFTNGLPPFSEEGSLASTQATPAAPLNTPGTGLGVDLNTVSPRFTPKDARLHKYYDKLHTERVPMPKSMHKFADKDSDIYSSSNVASSQESLKTYLSRDSGLSSAKSEESQVILNLLPQICEHQRHKKALELLRDPLYNNSEQLVFYDRWGKPESLKTYLSRDSALSSAKSEESQVILNLLPQIREHQRHKKALELLRDPLYNSSEQLVFYDRWGKPITDHLSGHDSGISRDMSEFSHTRSHAKGYPYGAPLSPVKSGSELSTPSPVKGPYDPKDWRKFFELPNAVERRQMEQIKREMEQGKLKTATLPPISYFAEDLPMLPGEAGTRLLQSVRVGEKAFAGDGKHRIESVPSKLQVHTQNEPAGLSSFGILQMQWTTGVPTVKDKLSPPQRLPHHRSQANKSHDPYMVSSTSLQRFNDVPSEEDILLPYLSTVTPPMSSYYPQQSTAANHYEWELPLPPPPAKESRITVPQIRRDHDSYCKYYQLVKKKLHHYTSPLGFIPAFIAAEKARPTPKQQKDRPLELPEVFVKQIRERQLTKQRKPSDGPQKSESQKSRKSSSTERATLTASKLNKLFPPIKIGQLVNIF